MTIAEANRLKALKPSWRASNGAALQRKYATDTAWHAKMADHARENGKRGGRPKGSVGRKKDPQARKVAIAVKAQAARLRNQALKSAAQDIAARQPQHSLERRLQSPALRLVNRASGYSISQ